MPSFSKLQDATVPVLSGSQALLRSRYRFAKPLENLEQRLMFSVSLDANGWTIVTPSSASENIIYVSSATGKDTNSGLTQAAPILTFKHAESLLQNNKPNEILLQAGLTYNDAFINWIYSGQDAQDPILISYYNPSPGTTPVLPIVNTGTNPSGFATPIDQPYDNEAVDYVDVIGLRFYANYFNPSSSSYNPTAAGGANGLYLQNPGNDLLFEDDSFEYYRYNMNIEAVEGPLTNITIRRCVDDYAYGANYSHSQGLYAYNVSNLSVIQSVFDHNGWSAVVATAEDLGFNHDIYIASTCSGIDIEENVLAEAAFAGVMARAGGIIDNNLFIDDAIAVAYGQANGADSTVGGVTGTLNGNVFVGDKGYDYGQVYGQVFDIGNIKPGAGLVVENNIATGDTQNAKPGIQLDPATGTTNPTATVGVNNVTIENNIVNGWRQSITTDGRFTDGGTGEFGFTALTVKNNDWLNATTQEVRHDNVYSSAQESWSGDNYFDSVLAQNNWITVASTGVPFSTWVSNYDIGAKLLPSMSVFPNPNVTIASYDATLGGAGTFQDFLANADTMSIVNYQPKYLALAGINYIQSGFGVPLTQGDGSTGSSGASGPPTAAAAALNLNTAQIGTTTYSFTVNYTDANALKTASLGGRNLLVTGPNGFSQFAAYVSSTSPTADASGYQHVSATYVITAPNGTWAAGEDGTYTITMLANQVYDSFGNPVPDGVIGTFSADFSRPTAVANITGPGSNAYAFTITYSDSAGIDTSTLDNFSVKVTGPSNFSKFATITNVSTTGNTTVATYIIVPTGSSFGSGTYTISLTAGTVSDLDGNAVTGGTLTTFSVNATATNTASISGTVFNDANGDGLLDNRESTLTGVTIFIDQAGNGIYNAAVDPHTLTDTNGAYSFTNLSAGQYTVMEVAASGFVITSPSTGGSVINLAAGQVLTSINFANQINTSVLSGSGSSTNSSTGTISGVANLSTGSLTGHSVSGVVSVGNAATGKTTLTGSREAVAG